MKMGKEEEQVQKAPTLCSESLSISFAIKSDYEMNRINNFSADATQREEKSEISL